MRISLQIKLHTLECGHIEDDLLGAVASLLLIDVVEEVLSHEIATRTAQGNM